jgi:hypothetical protein
VDKDGIDRIAFIPPLHAHEHHLMDIVRDPPPTLGELDRDPVFLQSPESGYNSRCNLVANGLRQPCDARRVEPGLIQPGKHRVHVRPLPAQGTFREGNPERQNGMARMRSQQGENGLESSLIQEKVRIRAQRIHIPGLHLKRVTKVPVRFLLAPQSAGGFGQHGEFPDRLGKLV